MDNEIFQPQALQADPTAVQDKIADLTERLDTLKGWVELTNQAIIDDRHRMDKLEAAAQAEFNHLSAEFTERLDALRDELKPLLVARAALEPIDPPAVQAQAAADELEPLTPPADEPRPSAGEPLPVGTKLSW